VCDGCGCDLRENAAEFPASAYRCAAVRMEHRCSVCSRSVPVDGLPAGGLIRCYGCGTEERIASAEWDKVLARIHGASDLVGEDPEGAEISSDVAIDEVNPFAATARGSAGVVFAPDEAGALSGWLPDAWRIWAAPAIPVAPETYEPYDVDADGEGRIRARSKGTTTRYGVDPRWVERVKGLVGAVSDENQLGRSEPDVVLDGRTARCPSCNRSLTPRRARVRCEGCRTVLHVPAHVRQAASADPRPDTWYLLFDGPSAHRRLLERDASVGAQHVYADDRPLGEMPRATPTRVRRALDLAYVIVVPLLFVAIAGLLQRAPVVLDWLGW
jgi:hypothetical protein